MKVERLVINRFKRFDKYEIDFRDQTLGEISNRYLILGDNGAGKTTILQAIALPLALATRQVYQVQDFDWIGFQSGRYARWGLPRIEVTIKFSAEEIETNRELALRWRDTKPADFWLDRHFIPPGEKSRITLVLDGFKLTNPVDELSQFWGRYYLLGLLRNNPAEKSKFSGVPRVFWFDQFRNLASPPSSPETDKVDQENGQNNGHSGGGRLNYEAGVGQLREYLLGWDYRRRVLTSEQDYLQKLDQLYQRIFPSRTVLGGIEPMSDSPDSREYYFLIRDGDGRTYDIAEMSAGEQNVFPILYEFVRQQIGYSVILIDEVDLNLHPPAAQALAAQLPKIDPTSQFIMTTHSEAVSNVMREEVIHRLPGGALCL